MAVKKIETLNKHQNPATNENEFDIENYMNVNWDKIKEVVDNNADELTTTQRKVTTLETDNTKNKQDISDIKTEQETQNDLLQRTQNALINITTPKSSNISVKDSSDLNAKVDVYGISRQKTRSGKNKFDIEKLTGANITDKDSTTGTFTMTSCWATTIMNNDSLQEILKPNTQYKCIADVTLSSKPNDLSSVNNHGDVLALFNSSTNTVYKILSVSSADEKNSWEVNATKSLNKTFTTPADLTGFVMIGYNYRTERLTIEGSFKIKNAMILEATENDESFEQYGASPSPKYPSEIENTGDNINLFNKEAVESGKYIEASTGEVKSSGETSASDYINIKDIKELILSGDDIVRTNGGAFYSSEKVYISGFTTTQIWSGIDIPDTANYVRVTATTANLDKIKLEKGKKATSYSSYKCGSIDITVCNKNLFDGDFSQGYDSNGNITSSNQFVCNTNLINVEENESYTISNNLNLRIASIAYYKDNEFVNFQANLNLVTITIPQNVNQIRFNFYKESTLNISDFIYCQFEKNTFATNYIEHKEQLITFPLAEGQKMYKDSYLADDGIHHKRTQVEIKGIETQWIYYSANDVWARPYLTFTNKKIGESNNTANALCNKAKSISWEEMYQNIDVVSVFTYEGDNRISIAIKKEDLETQDVEGVKKYFQKNNMIVEYNLATEEIEQYTPEQQEAYNKLQNVLSYKTETNVFTDKAQLVFKYVADTQTWVLNKLNNTNQQILEIAGGN